MSSINLPYVTAQAIATAPTVVSLPPANTVPIGSVRYVIADSTIYSSDGSVWTALAGGGGGGVTSVNGMTGVVLLDTDDIPEGSTNLYYTNARVDAELLTGKDAIFGNLQATVISNDVNIEDNLIVLDSALTGAPTLDSGIEVNRGTSTDAQLLWNEGTDRWTFGLAGSMKNMLLYTDFSATSPLAYDNTTGVFSLSFPLNAPGGTAVAPSYNFSADTGMYSPSSGIIGFSTNGVERMQIENNGLINMFGDLTIVGNFAAANYPPPPPTGATNTPVYYNNSGNLDSIPGRAIDPLLFTQSSNVTSAVDSTNVIVDNLGYILDVANTFDSIIQRNDSLALNGTVNNTARLYLGAMTGQAQDVLVAAYDITASAVNNFEMFNWTSTGSIGANFQGFFLANYGPVANNAFFQTVSNNNTVGGGLAFANWGNQTGADIAGSLRFLDWANQGTVSQFLSGLFLNSNEVVTKGLDFLALSVTANVGDGSGVSLSGLNINVQNTAVINGSIFGLDINNNAVFTGTNNQFYGANANSQAAGYSYNGYVSNNSGNMAEQIMGFNHTTTGSSRTSTGLNITMNGNSTDDAQGIRVNVTNQTSTNTRVHSLDINGATYSYQNVYRPVSGLFVDSGNNNFTDLHVALGSPVSNTDTLINNNIVAFLVEDDIAIGPVGLGQAHTSMISLLGVATGKQIDLIRGALVVATAQNPGYADTGIVDKFQGFVFAGAIAGGGSTVINEATGLYMPTGFDGYAGANWGLRIQGTTAENYLNKLAVGTVSETVASGFLIEVNGKSLHQDQVTTAVGFGLTVREGSNAKMGADTLVAGTVTVSTTAVTANSRIFHSTQAAGGVQGNLSIANVVPGTSFDILSDNALDTSTVAWMIVEGV